MTRIELWAFLEARALEERDACAVRWRQARDNAARVKEHLERLRGLYAEYGQSQRRTQARGHQVHQTSALRQTLSQLLSLQERAAIELGAAQSHERLCQEALGRAEGELLKARTVSERARQDAVRAQQRAEQRQLDAASIQRHWLARSGQPQG